MRPWFLAIFGLVCGAPWALAQDATPHVYPKFEVFAGYSAIETNDHSFNFRDIGPVTGLDFDEKGRGFEVAVTRNLNRCLGIMGDFAAHTSSFYFPITACGQESCNQTGAIHPWLFDFRAGPEIKARNRTRITPFVHALFGVAHSSATIGTNGPALNFSRTDAETGFAMAFGGGFDVRIVRYASFRGLLTYSQAYVGNEALPRQRVNGYGWSAGVLFTTKRKGCASHRDRLARVPPL